MRFVIVVPWLSAVGGNIIALDLASELAESGLDVTLICHTVNTTVLEEVNNRLGKVDFIFQKQERVSKKSALAYFKRQYLSSYGIKIANVIQKEHEKKDITTVLLISDEGITLAKHLKSRMGTKTPILSISVMELVEHNFFAFTKRFGHHISIIISPFYALLHNRYEKYLSFFDKIYTNSDWTSMMLSSFYGKTSNGEIQFVSNDFFQVPIKRESSSGKYIVVPTTSLDRTLMGIAERLSREFGESLIFYGDKQIPGGKNVGFLEFSDMIQLISKSNGMLFLFDYEALGLIPLEALALGIPVATFNKEGPSLSMKGAKMVTYVSTYEEIKNACHDFLNLNITDEMAAKCRMSVERFRPEKILPLFLEMENT